MVKVMVLGLRGFPDVQGGVEKHAEHLYPLLVELGCDVEVIARSRYLPAERKSWRGVDFRRLWAPGSSGIEALVHSLLGVIYAAAKRPDILHIHAIGPGIVTPLARLLGLKVVVTHHGPDYDREKWSSFARWLLRRGEAWSMRYSHRRIVISKVIRNLVAQKYGTDANVIPNGIDLPIIPLTDQAIRSFGLDKRRYVLLVSRFVPEKRHLDLIRAFHLADIAGWKLVLVGDADHPDRYSALVKQEAAQDGNVVLTGFQSGDALRELYAHAGMFVLPSSHEGLPIAMLEALSYGMPVIASDIPANLEVGLPPENYFDLGDIAALASMLRRCVASSEAERQRHRKLVENGYDWPRISRLTLEVYQAALGSSLSSRRTPSQ
ncbi:MAG: glycosyltransferase family 4 protein [Gammaproteobacteria bacterium]|nr:glycosyltransferase family 4 protein [Gammaproteobacteria bacterium]